MFSYIKQSVCWEPGVKLSPVCFCSSWSRAVRSWRAQGSAREGQTRAGTGRCPWGTYSEHGTATTDRRVCCLPVLHCVSVSYCKTSASRGKTFPIASFLWELLNCFWMCLHHRWSVFLYLGLVSFIPVRSFCAKIDLMNGGRSSPGINQPLMFWGVDWFTSLSDSVFTSRLKNLKSKEFKLQPFHTGLHNKSFESTVSLDPSFGVKFSAASRPMTTVLLIVDFSRQFLIYEVAFNQKHFQDSQSLLLCVFGHCS